MYIYSTSLPSLFTYGWKCMGGLSLSPMCTPLILHTLVTYIPLHLRVKMHGRVVNVFYAHTLDTTCTCHIHLKKTTYLTELKFLRGICADSDTLILYLCMIFIINLLSCEELYFQWEAIFFNLSPLCMSEVIMLTLYCCKVKMYSIIKKPTHLLDK